jgi:hypothetical protein
MAAIKQLSDANPSGTSLGQSATDLVSLYGVTPIAQRSGSSQVALVLTTAVSGGFGFGTSAAFATFTAQLEEIRATLAALGAFKGAA